MKKDTNILQPTYGTFEVEGIISKIDDSEGKTTKGDDYRSLKMTVKTDEVSQLEVELFGMEVSELEIVKFKGKEKPEKKKIKWSERNNIEEGFVLSNNRATSIGSELKDSKVRGGLKAMANYDAVTKIAEVFEIGDSVKIKGNIRFSEFATKAGEMITKATCNIQKIHKIEDIDFNKEDYKAYSKFEQDVIILGTEKIEDELFINGAIVLDKDENFVTQQFKVEIKERNLLAKNLSKLPLYSQIPLKGDIVIKSIMEDVIDEDGKWGGDEDVQKRVSTGRFERYFRVLAADGTKIEEEKYKPKDFESKDALTEELDDSFASEEKADSNDDWLD